MPLELRDYQVEALSDLYEAVTERDGNPLVVLPTGAGKSLVMAEWCRGIFQANPRARIVVATHVQELVEQDYAELIALWPDAPAGIYSAGLGKRQLHARILFASIQSIHRKALQVQQCDQLLIDEAHLTPRNADTMYGRFIKELRELNSRMKVVGLTATPYRLDSGMLTEGEGALFTEICHNTSPRRLMDAGYLVPLVSRGRAAMAIDTNGVHTRAGEFVAGELEDRAMDPEVIAKIVDDIVANGQDRHGWLVFGVSVAHIQALNDALAARGVASACVWGAMAKEDRKATLAAFQARRLRCLVSMGVLTTGFNAKHVDLVALVRPTKSTGLYIQMVGRGTRCLGANLQQSIANGKADCLVLDYGGNIRRHGPFDEPFIPEKKGKGDGTGEAPMRECPSCGDDVLIATLVCPNCGHEFPPPEAKVATTADTAAMILAPPPEWVRVDGVSYSINQGKMGKPDTLKVEYRCGFSWHNEYLCFDHMPGSYPQRKAMLWWMNRAPKGVGHPVSVAVAMKFIRGEGCEKVPLRTPTAIRVKPNGKYTEITDCRFEEPSPVPVRPGGDAVRVSAAA